MNWQGLRILLARGEGFAYSAIPAYGRESVRLLPPLQMVPASLPPPVHDAVAAVERSRAELGYASDRHRANLALLAAEIRATAQKGWTVNELAEEVARRKGLAFRTVLNALHETFRLDVMETCLYVLALRATSGTPRRAKRAA